MKKLNNLIWLFLFITFAFGQTDPPYWVSDSPSSNSQSYIGIGRSSTRNPDFSLDAELIALRSIALEINAQVSGSSRRSITERNDLSDKEFTDEVVVSTLANFKGLRKEVYTDERRGYYYVYLEYSKSQHEKNIAESKTNAARLVEEYQSINRRDFVGQLQKLVNTYELLFQVYGETIIASVDGRDVNLQDYIPSEISKLMRQLIFEEVGNTTLNGVYRQALESELGFDVFVKKPGINRYKLSNLPFTFEFEAGDGDFSFSEISSDESGYVFNGITLIKSNIPRQLIVAYPALNKLRYNATSFPYFEKVLKNIASQSLINFSLDVDLVKTDKVTVWVKSSEGLSGNSIRSINDAFDISFKNNTSFTLIDRQTAEAILEKNNQSSADVCDNSECRIQLGQALGVEKFVLVDITYIPGSRRISAVIRYTDVVRKISDAIKKYDVRVRSNDVEGAVFNNIDNWVKDFYGVLNPPTLNIYTNVTNVRIDLGGKYEYLPLIDYNVEPGTYTFKYEKDGYETRTQKVTLVPNDQCCEDIEMKEKTRFKAFYKSLFLPGSGQRYNADSKNTSFVAKGWRQTILSALITGGMVYSWYLYTDAQNNYNSAQLAYSKATSVEAIEATKSEAKIANSDLNQAYNIALGTSVSLFIYSLYSAIDAAISQPEN